MLLGEVTGLMAGMAVLFIGDDLLWALVRAWPGVVAFGMSGFDFTLLEGVAQLPDAVDDDALAVDRDQPGFRKIVKDS